MNRTVKMYNGFEMDENLEFTFNDNNLERSVATGGSKEAGLEAGNDVHTHGYNHYHSTGTIEIISTGAHTHTTSDVSYSESEVFPLTAVDEGAGNIQVAARDHEHQILVSGGAHIHRSVDFSGNVANLIDSGINTQTEETSTWAPYKEILFCIKK